MDFNEIKFRPGSNSRVRIEKVKKWRGDHSGCGHHRNGECRAAYAWTVDNGTWRIRPDIGAVSIEPTMLGTSKAENKKGAYEIPTWQAKGWVEPEEAEGVRPTEAVKRWHIDRLVNERRLNLEHKKAEYAFIEKDTKALRIAAEKANGLESRKDGE